MENVLDLKMPGVQVLGKEELKEVDGGMTAKQEIWLERGISFALFGLLGLAIYELGRANG